MKKFWDREGEGVKVVKIESKLKTDVGCENTNDFEKKFYTVT